MSVVGDVISGGLGGLACVLAGQPLDTIKVKMQTYPGMYSSTFQALKTTLVEEKFRGFYAGSSPAIISNIAENAVLFLCYNKCLSFVQWIGGNENLTLTQKASAGSLASLFSSIAITPPEQIKCKMQAYLQTLRTKYPGSSIEQIQAKNKVNTWIIVKQIVRNDGITGLFRGLTSTWAREVPGYFFFFGGYHLSREKLTLQGQDPNDLSVPRLALAGGLGGCGYWLSVFPTDTVKSRIQVRGEYTNSFLKTLTTIIRTEGVLALYRGLVPTLIRSFPANGALFVTYEYSRKLFQPRDLETLDSSTV